VRPHRTQRPQGTERPQRTDGPQHRPDPPGRELADEVVGIGAAAPLGLAQRRPGGGVERPLRPQRTIGRQRPTALGQGVGEQVPVDPSAHITRWIPDVLAHRPQQTEGPIRTDGAEVAQAAHRAQIHRGVERITHKHLAHGRLHRAQILLEGLDRRGRRVDQAAGSAIGLAVALAISRCRLAGGRRLRRLFVGTARHQHRHHQRTAKPLHLKAPLARGDHCGRHRSGAGRGVHKIRGGFYHQRVVGERAGDEDADPSISARRWPRSRTKIDLRPGGWFKLGQTLPPGRLHRPARIQGNTNGS
jgi:hypothetical protein